jgi:hypothetical protein
MSRNKPRHRRRGARGVACRDGGEAEPVDAAIEVFSDDLADGAEAGDGDPLHGLSSPQFRQSHRCRAD